MRTLASVWIKDALAVGGCGGRVEPLDRHLRGVMEWLCRAQDACEGGGVSRGYALRHLKSQGRRGWLAAYPETTGYIIPTFFDYGALTGDASYRERAVRMGEWEVKVQMDCGAVQGGVIDFPPFPAVFNTGQVLFGWVRAFQETGREVFRRAAVRAADFLVDAQDPDGAWRRHGSKYARAGVNVYDVRTAWGLAEAAQLTADPRHREAAVRNLDYALTRQRPNGWFEDCGLDEDPLLHTFAYTMEGFLETGALLDRPAYIEAARRAADALLVRQRADGSLAGCYDASWCPVVRWSCLTGDSQIALVWLRLHEFTGGPQYLAAARRLNRYVMATQDLAARDPGIRGAIKGSDPIWGAYAAYEYPNWAAKFFADALMLEQRLT